MAGLERWELMVGPALVGKPGGVQATQTCVAFVVLIIPLYHWGREL